MGTFVVYGSKTIRSTVVVEADDRRDAVRKFKESVKDDYNIPDVVEDCSQDEAWEVIGFDEGTGEAIFEGDDYCHDEEGIMWLPDENGDCGCDEEDA